MTGGNRRLSPRISTRLGRSAHQVAPEPRDSIGTDTGAGVYLVGGGNMGYLQSALEWLEDESLTGRSPSIQRRIDVLMSRIQAHQKHVGDKLPPKKRASGPNCGHNL